MEKKNEKKCRICGKKFEGYGHNAEPVNSGLCCDRCQYIESAERLRRTLPVPYSIGQKIHILKLQGEEQLTGETYLNREGVITSVDDIGQLHGTWGGLAVIPEVDRFFVVREQD